MIKNDKHRLFEMMNRVADMPVDVSDTYLPDENAGQPLDEVDLEGVTHTCMNIDQLRDYLNKILANYALPSHKRVKPDLIVHNKVIKKTEEGEIDVQTFINDITAEPDQIISTGNAKMLKSSTEDFYTVTIGLPAFRGIVYDKDRKNFIVVHTCPGAGKCVAPCYARKGNYVRLPFNFLKQTRILNLLLNDPQRFKEKLKNEIMELKNNPGLVNKEMRFRWNDSGDFFSKSYYQVGREIMKELKDEGFVVKPYAHTKVADIYNLNRLPSDFSNMSLKTDAPDFVVSFSVDANKKQLKKVDLAGAKTSEIVGSEYFNDLFVKSDPHHFDVDANDRLIFKDKENGMNVLKQRVSKGFNVPNDGTLLSHDEMMKAPVADKPTYNVIVQSKGETDISTQRPDVLRTFFLVH
ncbi:MAG: hypothetical protein WC333_01330 [Dehalococcoidia bacterium]|jgi:hypothetical protein